MPKQSIEKDINLLDLLISDKEISSSPSEQRIEANFCL